MATALLLSGGNGTRLGSEIPKQYIKVNNKPIIIYALETLDKCAHISKIQIVAAQEWQEKITGWLKEYKIDGKFSGFSLPGENRQLSIFNGLKDIERYAPSEEMVLIHDAARPCLSLELIEKSVLTMEEGHDGVLPVLPMKDTVYASKDGYTIDSLLNRREIFAGQAPETFALGKYINANERLLPDKIKTINGSTEPAILAGLDVVMIEGDEKNFKITTMTDLERFREIVAK